MSGSEDAVGGGPGGGQEFTTVRASEMSDGGSVHVRDGQNVSNRLVILDDPSKKPRFFLHGDASIVNIGFKNECQNSGDGGVGIKIVSDGQGLIENVYLGDGCVPGHICPLFASKSSAGSVTIRNVNIQDWPDNAAYTDPPKSGGGAEMHYERCYFARCTSGIYRLSDGTVTECVALVNSPGARAKLREKDRGPGKPAGSRISSGQGIWGRRNANVVAERCLFHMPHESGNSHAKADDDNSTVVMRNSMLGGLSRDDWGNGSGASFENCTQWQPGDGVPWDQTGQPITDGGQGVPAPPGVPLTAEEAASGNASADGTTIPPGGMAGAGAPGRRGSGYGGGGIGGVYVGTDISSPLDGLMADSPISGDSRLVRAGAKEQDSL